MENNTFYYAQARARNKNFFIITDGKKMGLHMSLEGLKITEAEKKLQLLPKGRGDSYFGDPGDFVAGGEYYSNGPEFQERVEFRNSHIIGRSRRKIVVSSPGHYWVHMLGDYSSPLKEYPIEFNCGYRSAAEFFLEGKTVTQVTVADIIREGKILPDEYVNLL
jgi:hypothetical protein